jgi:ABC-2 type transport system ATP-binding protein
MEGRRRRMIEAVGLMRRYGPVTAVDGVSFCARPGEVLGVLGPNGAGKTTTMRMLAGVLEPDAGAARICGRDMARDRRAAQSQLGYLPEGAPLFPEMTAADYLDFLGRTRGLGRAARKTAVEKAGVRAGLEGRMGQIIDTMSKGYRRRVALAGAILHEPPALILDEPTDGLDPLQKRAMRSLIAELSATSAVVISTHILDEAEAVCSRALVIAGGRVLADDTPRALAARVPSGRLDDAFAALCGAEGALA